MVFYGLSRQVDEEVLRSRDEKRGFEKLARVRETDNENFTKIIATIFTGNKERGASLFNKLELTPQEHRNFTIDLFELGAITAEQTEQILKSIENSAKVVQKAKPTGGELFTAAIHQLHQENPTWKPSRFQRYAESRIKQYFKKKPKPFSNEDVTVGATWYETVKRNLTTERDQNSRRLHRGANVSFRKWQELFRLRFSTPTPEFAKEYQKAVTAEARKRRKNKRNERR